MLRAEVVMVVSRCVCLNIKAVLKMKTGKSIEEVVFVPAGGVTVPPSAQIYQRKHQPKRKIVLLFFSLDIKEKETV